MNARVLAEVKARDRLRHAAKGRLQHGLALAGQGQDAAVVIGVLVRVEERRADDAPRRRLEAGDPSGVPPLAEVGHTFDQHAQTIAGRSSIGGTRA